METMIAKQADAFTPLIKALAPLFIIPGILTEVTYDEGLGYGIKVDGFYKDGSVVVRAMDNEGQDFVPIAIIEGRYEMLLEIFDGDDILEKLIELNSDRFAYWCSVKPFDTWTPSTSWAKLLVDRGYLKAKTVTTYVPA